MTAGRPKGRKNKTAEELQAEKDAKVKAAELRAKKRQEPVGKLKLAYEILKEVGEAGCRHDLIQERLGVTETHARMILSDLVAKKLVRKVPVTYYALPRE